MSSRLYKNKAQGLVEYALILVLIAVVVIGLLAFFGSSTSGGLPIPFLSKRPPYPPRADYGRVEDVVIRDIAVSSVRANEGPAFGQDVRVAVYTFDAPQGTQGGVLVSDIFAATLREKGYQVFERSEIERVLREQQLLIEGRTTASDLDIAQRLGQLGAVQYMVFGAVTLYNSEGQTVLLPVTVAQEDREVYEEEYAEYRDWYINGFRLAPNRWATDAFDRAEMLRAEEGVLSIEELEEELLKEPREEFRTIASVGISAKIVDVQTGEIIWMGQSETTDFTLVQASSRVVEELLNSALSP